MAANIEPIFVVQANIKGTVFVNATGTTITKIWEPDTTLANGGVVRAINVANDDSASGNIDIILWDGTTNFYVCTMPVTAGYGITAATFAQNALDPIRFPGLNDDGELFVPDNWEVRAAMKVAVTAAKSVWVTAIGADF